MRYKVTFEFTWLGDDSDSKYHDDYLDNNGRGFTLEDAKSVARDLRYNTCSINRNIQIVPM